MNDVRTQIYALLSRMYMTAPDAEALDFFRKNAHILEQIGPECEQWFFNTPFESLQNTLTEDFTGLFITHNYPVECRILEHETALGTGFENPVMLFYTQKGFRIDLSESPVKEPDHLAIELGFMQQLCTENDLENARKFLKRHLGFWAPPFLLGVKQMAKTPFYRDLCDFTAEYLVSDLCHIEQQLLSQDF